MAKGSDALERQFIESAREKTGHDVDEWMEIIKASGESKAAAIITWLKTTHRLNHSQATYLALIYLNDGQPVFDYPTLFRKLFDGKDGLKPAYDALAAQVRQVLPDVEFIPTKTYVSIEGDRVFGCATLTKDAIRVGLDLGDMAFGDYVQKAKGLGAMPNITHMIEIRTPGDVSDALVGYVEQAYRRVHKQ